jgi:hypothetical protein
MIKKHNPIVNNIKRIELLECNDFKRKIYFIILLSELLFRARFI